MTLHVIGVSHHTASAREQAAFSLSPDQVGQLLAAAAHRSPQLEAVILATCNRTEFYLAGEDALQRWDLLLGELCPAAPRRGDERWYHHEGPQAFEHLLRVATGLDSALLGDGQVLGQLRRAVAAAQAAGSLGGVLSPATAVALRTGRRARAETDIGRGAPGVGSAVAATLQVQGIPVGAPILLLGAGEASRTIVRALHKAGYHQLRVTNRTAAAARQLAEEHTLTQVAWADLDVHLSQVAAVVAATAAPQPVLRYVPPPAEGRRLLVLDAGFPPQVGTGVGGPQVQVVSLESLAEAADAAAAARSAAAPLVEALVAEQVRLWQHEQERHPLEEAIRHLHAEAGRATRSAALTLAGRSTLTSGDVELVLQRSVKALLHDHVARLRALHPRLPS